MGSNKSFVLNERSFTNFTMKINYFILPVALSEIIEYESAPIANDTDFRAFGTARNMLAIALCPGLSDDPSYCRDGFTLPNGRRRSHKAEMARLMLNHGCNCFPKSILHRNGNSMTPSPGLTGRPVDDLDQACTVLAKRNKCLQLDNALECDYGQEYRYYYNTVTKEIACGREGKPLYSADLDYDNNPGKKCARQLCNMDLEFVNNIIAALSGMSVREYRLEFQHFDRLRLERQGTPLECEAAGTAESPETCCGTVVPSTRTPYNSNTHRCCNDFVIMRGSGREVDFCTASQV